MGGQAVAYQRFRIVVLLVLAIVWAVSIQPVIAQSSADLSLTKTADRSRVRLGEEIVYTITVTNLGPDVATNVIFGGAVTDAINWIAFTCQEGTRVDEVSTFCVVDSLQAGQSAVAILVAVPVPNLNKDERRIDNTAFVVSSDTPDPTTENDLVTVRVRVIGRIPR